MEILAPAAAGALAAVPAIVALYLLKVRGPAVRVATFGLWQMHLADRQANAPWKRLRPSWLLLVQVLVALALALALMRPGVVGAAGETGTTVVLIDGSASMQATDVAPTRFESALRRAGSMADSLGPGQEMAVVVLGTSAQLLVSPTGDPGALRAGLGRARPSGEAADLAEGFSVANAVLAGRPGGRIVLFSDGHARRPAATPELSAPLRYESVGTSRGNLALATLGRTPSGAVFLRIANLGDRARNSRVELRADGRLVDVLPVSIEPGSSVEPEWTGLPDGTGLLEARLTPADSFTLDDAAWLVTEPVASRRVVVVTQGNDFLVRALRLRDDLDVTVVDPAGYRNEPYDLYVFDGFAPEDPSPGPALYVDPPEGAGPVPAGPDTEPGEILPVDPREPVVAHVSLRDVHVQSASAMTQPPGWRTVVAAGGGPLLLVRESEPRQAQLAFDIHRSDLALRGAFPVLVQNLVSFLVPGGGDDGVVALGRPATVSAGPGVRSIEVETPAGRRLRLPPPFPTTVTDTGVPGVYTVREEGDATTRTSRFVVQMLDTTQSRLDPGPAPEVRVATAPLGTPPRGTLEIWPWLAGTVFVGLVLEWLMFVRT